MKYSKVKVISILFVVLLFIGFISVGCKPKSNKGAWVNTDSMPGNTFVNHNKKGQSAIVYLGSDEKKSADTVFGPTEVSFEFANLR